MANGFLEEFNFNNTEFHEFYKQHRKKVYYRLNRKRQVMASVNGILLTLKNMIVEYKGGVFIEGFGYFFFLKNPHQTRKTKAKTLLGKFKKYNKFYPCFIADTELEGWTFNDMFIPKFILQYTRDDYTIHFDICQSIKSNFKYMRKQIRIKR